MQRAQWAQANPRTRRWPNDQGDSNQVPGLVRDLSSLPPEIRNIIYKHVLGPPLDPTICFTEPIDPRPLNFGYDDRGARLMDGNIKESDCYWQVWPFTLDLLLVSKQIYRESFHIFYATHCFSFLDTDFLYHFLRKSGYARRQHISQIRFIWRGSHAKKAFRLLKTCQRLRTVQLIASCSHPPGYAALCEVRGLEKVDAKAMIHFEKHRVKVLGCKCWGDYYCHCACRKPGDPKSDLQELEMAMMRPRLPRFKLDPNESIDPLNSKRSNIRNLEEETLGDETETYFRPLSD